MLVFFKVRTWRSTSPKYRQGLPAERGSISYRNRLRFVRYQNRGYRGPYRLIGIRGTFGEVSEVVAVVVPSSNLEVYKPKILIKTPGETRLNDSSIEIVCGLSAFKIYDLGFLGFIYARQTLNPH